VKDVTALLLAAGLGTRLGDLTENWPKCLMPVGGKPLLEHWLCMLKRCSINRVLVNVHHHRHIVESFLSRENFKDWVERSYEPKLLGTAGTIRENYKYFAKQTALIIHADNWCQCDLSSFIRFHQESRPTNTVMTMMTFRTDAPSECGVVKLNKHGVVQEFKEKVENPPSNIGNAAIYLLEPEVVGWINQQRTVTDFSTEVIPKFQGRIATWENTRIHRDIGTRKSLIDAQKDPRPAHCWSGDDEWFKAYSKNKIHSMLAKEN
jgi:mannose-1-phosphate guanylyltransferase